VLEFAVVREFLDAYSCGPQAFIPIAPIPTPKLLSALTSITLVAEHPDDLKTGIQPFMAMDGSEAYRAASLDIARSFNLLSGRDSGITLADIDRLSVPKDLRSHPVSFFELEKSLGLFGNLCGAILGEQHPIVVQYRPFWSALTGQFRTTLHQEIDIRKVIKPVHILRNIQLTVHHWFHSKKCNPHPSPPDFYDILLRLSLSTYTLPNLPQALYQLVTPKSTLRTLTRTLTLPPPTPTLTLSDASTTPSFASTITQSLHTAPTSRAGTFVSNDHADITLMQLIPHGQKIKDLIGTSNPPLSDAGQPLCLSFHLKGGCFSNCRRQTTHTTALTAAEKDRLSNYVADRLGAASITPSVPP
jgi:hypothetical protein